MKGYSRTVHLKYRLLAHNQTTVHYRTPHSLLFIFRANDWLVFPSHGEISGTACRVATIREHENLVLQWAGYGTIDYTVRYIVSAHNGGDVANVENGETEGAESKKHQLRRESILDEQ